MMMSAAAATVSIRWRTATTPSMTDRWHTPEALYMALDREFAFTIDVAADSDNAKCDRFLDREADALGIDWSGERVFCNPPYGRELGVWIEKGMLAAQDGGATVVMLLPARTGNRWFHRYCLPHGEVRFIQGRLNSVAISAPIADAPRYCPAFGSARNTSSRSSGAARMTEPTSSPPAVAVTQVSPTCSCWNGCSGGTDSCEGMKGGACALGRNALT